MKTSEFIRAAVDNWLAPCYEDVIIFDKYIGLCPCFAEEYKKINPNEFYGWAYPPLVDSILDELGETSSYLFPRGAPEKEFAQQQAMRFMFAEFLALYFEDMGD